MLEEINFIEIEINFIDKIIQEIIHIKSRDFQLVKVVFSSVVKQKM